MKCPRCGIEWKCTRSLFESCSGRGNICVCDNCYFKFISKATLKREDMRYVIDLLRKCNSNPLSEEEIIKKLVIEGL